MNKKILALGLASVLTLGVGCSSKEKVKEPVANKPAIEEQENVGQAIIEEENVDEEETSLKENILGKWENEETSLEFTEDGIVKQVTNTSGPQKVEVEVGEGVELIGGNDDGTVDMNVESNVNIEMEYEIIDENIINLVIMGFPAEYSYEINGDTLIMEDIGELIKVK